MNAAQLIDVLLKIPASKRKLYQVNILPGTSNRVEDAEIVREQQRVWIKAEGSK